MSLMILNQKALRDINETYLRMCDPEELKEVITEVKEVNSAGNGGFRKENRDMRFRGNIPSEIYWRIINRFPKFSKEKENAKREFYSQFPKFASEQKSKYIQGIGGDSQ